MQFHVMSVAMYYCVRYDSNHSGCITNCAKIQTMHVIVFPVHFFTHILAKAISFKSKDHFLITKVIVRLGYAALGFECITRY